MNWVWIIFLKYPYNNFYNNSPILACANQFSNTAIRLGIQNAMFLFNIYDWLCWWIMQAKDVIQL